jgi:glycosyltransferase involved in cell wall biosynthesis
MCVKKMNAKRLKVLIIAYECSPYRSHAPGSAWQIISRLAKRHDLWVITEASQYQVEVEEFLQKNSFFLERINFKFLPRSWSGYKKSRPIVPIKSFSDYKKWLKNAYYIAKELHSEVTFDIVHHLRGNSAREPGYCWQLPVPYIWGPTGGTTRIPWQMLSLLNLRDGIMQTTRNVITDMQFRYKPRLRNAVKKAACVIAQTSFDKKQFKKVHGIDAQMLHEQAANPAISQIRKIDEKRPLKIMWAGQCISRKGLPILLHAIADSGLKRRIILHLAGDGPLKKIWQGLAAQLGIADCCIWHGWLSQTDTLALMHKSDAFVFPSLLEATSTAVMEALSTGLPVMCIKHCGFGDVVDETCGFLFEATDVQEAIKGFRNAIVSLIDNPARLEKLSIGAAYKAKQYSWDNLAASINEIYITTHETYGLDKK